MESQSDFKTLESGSLPMNRGRIIKTLADSTIRNILDAIVELVTNCDDSYARGEQSKKTLSGRIDVNVIRGSQGLCKEIIIADEATGMDHQKLKESIEFSSETSGFKEGGNVRGFFGRGLKESIIALGKGEILTLKDGVLSRAEIYYDEAEKDVQYKLAIPVANLSPEVLLNFGFSGNSGTVIKIDITNLKKSYIPARTSLGEQIKNHFSLRSINSSLNRNVYIHFKDEGSKDKYGYDGSIKYAYPEGSPVFEEDINVDGSSTHFKIYESTVQLESPRTPTGSAGLLIKTEGAILDNQLFGFDTDPIGLYFFGEATCPGISKAIREGDESIVDYNRGGLDWRHPFNKELEKVSREILDKLIKSKKEKLSSDEQTHVSEPIEKLLDKISKKLADLAKSELEDNVPGPGEIESLMIRPIFANVEPGIERKFSIYAPKYVVENEATVVVQITSSNDNIVVGNSSVELGPHKKDPNLFKAAFEIMGTIEGEVSKITATLGRVSASCEVRVAPLGKIGPHKPSNKYGGFFRKIKPATDDNPIQRFEYEEGGTLRIYTKFPGVNNLLGENFEKISSPEGKIVMAEIIIEAFSRLLSRKRAGIYFSEEIDPLMWDMDRLREKATDAIYSILLHSDISSLLDD